MDVDLHSYGVAGMFLAMVFAPAVVGARSSRDESRRLSEPRPKKPSRPAPSARRSLRQSDREAEDVIAQATLGFRRNVATAVPSIVRELPQHRSVTLPFVPPATEDIPQNILLPGAVALQPVAPEQPAASVSSATSQPVPQNYAAPLQEQSGMDAYPPPAPQLPPARLRAQWVETAYLPPHPVRLSHEARPLPPSSHPEPEHQQQPHMQQHPGHPYLQQPWQPHASHPVPFAVPMAAPQPWPPMQAYYPYQMPYGMPMYAYPPVYPSPYPVPYAAAPPFYPAPYQPARYAPQQQPTSAPQPVERTRRHHRYQ